MTDGWTDDGRQIRRVIGYFEEEKDCRDALDKHRFDPIGPKADVTFGELYREWSENKYAEGIGRDTINSYKAAWKYLSRYKNVKVVDLRTAHLQSVINACRKANLSRSTMEKIRVTAVLLFKYAIENDIVNKNYAEFIKLPKAEKTEKERFTDLEIQQLLKAAPGNEWVGTVLILIYTGMRISEMLSLTKFNVDMENGIITGGIKTEAGKNRVIPIHPKIMRYVRHWYDKDGEALICDNRGKRLLPKRYREKLYYPALKTAGVRQLTPHACRHTFGSMMADAGVDPVHIQKIIGHADYRTTANTYTHLEIETLKDAIRKI